MTQAPRVTVRAYAKINLGLEVLGKRPDGLHEIRTVLQTIDLSDRLDFAPGPGVSLRCRGMRVTPDNLILQAAHLMKDRGSVAEGVDIACLKRIPIGAGLGGGSADAAVTLCTLWSFWGVRLDADTLVDLAGRLGADVPFCLRGGTALASGDGREVQALPPAPPHWVVLVSMDSGDVVKTGGMYGRLTAGDWSDGARVHLQAEAIRGGRLDYGSIGSAFEPHAIERWPRTRQALEVLEEEGALAASVSGSGPSVFGLFLRRVDGLPALHRLRRLGLPASIHRFVGPVDLLSRAAA
jgi:4-diphosphocytidyl-2-C-methyl-D-erythritol kinase